MDKGALAQRKIEREPADWAMSFMKLKIIFNSISILLLPQGKATT